MKPLTLRERRLFALAILAVMLAALWGLVLDPVIGGYFRLRDEREQLEAQLARNQRLAAGLGEWKAAADTQAGTAASFAIRAATSALATEVLKEQLVAVATDAGGTVKTVMAVDQGVPDHWVRVRADLRLSHQQLYDVLRHLAGEVPYAVVDFLSVVADRAAASGRLEPLEASLAVSAPVILSMDQGGAPTGSGGGVRGVTRPCRRTGVASHRRGTATIPLSRPRDGGRRGSSSGRGTGLAANTVQAVVFSRSAALASIIQAFVLGWLCRHRHRLFAPGSRPGA